MSVFTYLSRGSTRRWRATFRRDAFQCSAGGSKKAHDRGAYLGGIRVRRFRIAADGHRGQQDVAALAGLGAGALGALVAELAAVGVAVHRHHFCSGVHYTDDRLFRNLVPD